VSSTVTAPVEPGDALTALAVIHGRFQPLHIGHLEYLLAGKRICDQLVVGISNPDPVLTVIEEADPARGLRESNPCTYYERHLMVEGALVEAGIPQSDFRIVPFPHGRPDLLSNYAPPEALYLLTIYDPWGETKLSRFRHLDLSTHVMWRRSTKVTSGSEVRSMIARGDRDWERLVPPAVAAVIHHQGIDRRLRETHA